MKPYNKCEKCRSPKPVNEPICENCISKLDLEQGADQVEIDKSTAKTIGFLFSVPTAVVFLLVSLVSEAGNSGFLVVAAIAFFVALPWSIAALAIFLFAVPMNTGLHPDIEGYGWRVVLACSAAIITILGAHFNGLKLARSVLRRRRINKYAQKNYQ